MIKTVSDLTTRFCAYFLLATLVAGVLASLDTSAEEVETGPPPQEIR